MLFHFPSKKLENKKSIKTLSLGGHYNPFFLFPHWFLIKCQFFASSMSLLFPFPCKKQQNKKFVNTLSLGGRVFLFFCIDFWSYQFFASSRSLLFPVPNSRDPLIARKWVPIKHFLSNLHQANLWASIVWIWNQIW